MIDDSETAARWRRPRDGSSSGMQYAARKSGADWPEQKSSQMVFIHVVSLLPLTIVSKHYIFLLCEAGPLSR